MLHAGLLRLPTDKGASLRPAIDWRSRFEVLAQQTKDDRLRRYYEQAMPDGTTAIKDVRPMAMDVETTGLNPAKDGIVSVGILPITHDTIIASASRHWIIQPHVPLASESVTIHGITHTQIANAPTLQDILGDLLQAIAGHVLVVHCRAIERTFLNNALQSLIHEPIEIPVIDTMELEARLHRNKAPLSWWDRVVRKKVSTPVSIRLADSRRRYGLPFYKPHHALTDALATAELFQAQIAHRYSPDTALNDLWC